MITAIIQTRMDSKRLPGKCMMELNGTPMTDYTVKAVKDNKYIDKLIIAIPDEAEKSKVFENRYGEYIYKYNGDCNDVLSRFYYAIKDLEPETETVIRLTSDCPLLYYFNNVISETILCYFKNNYDYHCNRNKYPSGLDVEVFSKSMLNKAFFKSREGREHVTTYMRKDKLITKEFNHKWSVDTLDDFKKVEDIIKLMEAKKWNL